MSAAKQSMPFVGSCALVVVCAVLVVPVGVVGQKNNTSKEDDERFSSVRTIAVSVPGTDWRITASEGPREPASIGSYALRLYVPFDPEWPFDNYVGGEVRMRDGSLEQVLFDDLNEDKTMDVLVVQRSAGSGGYLRVDGFLLQKDGIVFAHSVDGLASDADPVASLKADMDASD